jgi:branched-chain amino acid transport system substrate-binding protein
MKKQFAAFLPVILFALIFAPSAWSGKDTIRIGINAPITGDIPKVGEGTKFTARMWLADIKTAGGIKIGGKMYQVELVIEDNESKAESAVKVNTKMITEDEVLVIVGPQASKQAVPAGDVAKNYKTPMISPWSTNPDTTKDRPYVFRGYFLDPFQGPALANFITSFVGMVVERVGYRPLRDAPRASAAITAS